MYIVCCIKLPIIHNQGIDTESEDLIYKIINIY